MLLPMFDLATRKWEGEFPLPNTLAQAIFPDVAYALLHAGAEDVDAGTLAEGAAQAAGTLHHFSVLAVCGGDECYVPTSLPLLRSILFCHSPSFCPLVPCAASIPGFR